MAIAKKITAKSNGKKFTVKSKNGKGEEAKKENIQYFYVSFFDFFDFAVKNSVGQV
jgi:hypothetical protein